MKTYTMFKHHIMFKVFFVSKKNKINKEVAVNRDKLQLEMYRAINVCTEYKVKMCQQTK